MPFNTRHGCLLLALAASALPAEEDLPKCYCDTYVNGMSTLNAGDHGCMSWHTNNPFLSITKPDVAGLGKRPGAAIIKCQKADKGIKKGLAVEFDEKWQGGCPGDQVKCLVVAETPEWQTTWAGGCGCTHYEGGAHPEKHKAHLCVTTYPTELKDGKAGPDRHVCRPPVNGYEARYGEALMNYGCDHPARPCNPQMDAANRPVPLSCGVDSSCVILADGNIVCWGPAEYKLMGDGNESPDVFRSPPGAAALPSPNGAAVAVAVGEYHVCRLVIDGSVECWGYNGDLQLGIGSVRDTKRGDARATPAPVIGLGGKVIAISAADQTTCALLVSGVVECWGYNEFGQIGMGYWDSDRDYGEDVHSVGTPTPVLLLGGKAIAIAVGPDHCCAILEGGYVECWGRNKFGELGDGTTGDPRPKAGVRVVGLGGGANAATALAIGKGWTCALLADGTVRSWGKGDGDTLGDGTGEGGSRSTPTPVVGLGGGVQAIAAGWLHTCALLADASVKCWGNNEFKQLGQATGDSHQPAAVDLGGKGVRAIDLGAAHTCALLETGDVMCWGMADAGQLGNGWFKGNPSEFTHVPQRVEGLSGPIWGW